MDHYKFCRLCLCAGNSLIDVFEGENHLGYVIEETIQEVLQFKIVKKVGMPWMACSNCLNRLIEFKQFKRRCLESKTTFENRMREIEILRHNMSNGTSSNATQPVSTIFYANMFKDIFKAPRETARTFNPTIGKVESLSCDSNIKRVFEEKERHGSVNPPTEPHKIWFSCGQDQDPSPEENEEELDGKSVGEDDKSVEATINEIDIDEMDTIHIKNEPPDTDDEDVKEHIEDQTLCITSNSGTTSSNSCAVSQKENRAGPSATESVATDESQENIGKDRKKSKGYSCDNCGKVYIRRKSLQTHLLSHSRGVVLSRRISRLSQKMPVNYAALHYGLNPFTNCHIMENEIRQHHSAVDQDGITLVGANLEQGKRKRGRPKKFVTLNIADSPNCVDANRGVLTAESNNDQDSPMKRRPGRPRKTLQMASVEIDVTNRVNGNVSNGDKLPEEHNEKEITTSHFRQVLPNVPLSTTYQTSLVYAGLLCNGTNLRTIESYAVQPVKSPECELLEIASGLSVSGNPVLDHHDKAPRESERPEVPGKQSRSLSLRRPLNVSSTSSATHGKKSRDEDEHGKSKRFKRTS